MSQSASEGTTAEYRQRNQSGERQVETVFKDHVRNGDNARFHGYRDEKPEDPERHKPVPVALINIPESTDRGFLDSRTRALQGTRGSDSLLTFYDISIPEGTVKQIDTAGKNHQQKRKREEYRWCKKCFVYGIIVIQILVNR